MSRTSQLHEIIVQQSSKRVLLTKLTVATSAAVQNIASSVTLYGRTYTVLPGAQLCLVADQTMYYNICPQGATTAVTLLTGSNPGSPLLANIPDFTYALPVESPTGTSPSNLLAVDAVSSTGSTNLAIYLCV